MRQYLRQNSPAYVQVPMPADRVPESISAQWYDTTGTAQWSPAHDVDVVAWTVSGALTSGSRSLDVSSWGTYRVPQEGDELFLSAASEGNIGPRETVLVDRVDGTTLHLRSALRLEWADGSKIHPRVIRVPLTATDTASTGRTYRVEVAVTYSDLPTEEASDSLTELCDIVAHVPRCVLTLSEIRETYPSLFGVTSGDMSKESSGVEQLRDRCFRLVLGDVAQKINPDLIYSDADLSQPTLARMLLEKARDGSLYPADMDRQGLIAGQYGHYEREMTTALSSMGWVDRNEDGIPDDGETRTSVMPRLVWGL